MQGHREFCPELIQRSGSGHVDKGPPMKQDIPRTSTLLTLFRYDNVQGMFSMRHRDMNCAAVCTSLVLNNDDTLSESGSLL